jgi:hypothetical protein
MVRMFVNINMSINKNSLSEHKNINGKPVLGDVS